MEGNLLDFTHLSKNKNKNALYYFFAALKKKRGVFIEGALATLVLSILGLAVSIYTLQVYDRVIPNNGIQTLWVLTVGVGLAIVFEFIMKEARAGVIDKACKAIDLELSDFFFTKAIRVRMDQRPSTIGTFAAQIRLYESVRNFMTSTTLFLIADIPFAFLFIGVIALISPTMAIVPLILFPAAIMVGYLFRRPIEKLTNKSLAESTLKNGLLIESIDGIEMIKAHKAEKNFIDRWNHFSESIASSDLKLKQHMILSSGITQAIQQAAYIGLVATGVFEIMHGNLTIGGLLASTIISQRALAPAAQTATVIMQWEHSKMALKGLDAILSLPADGELESQNEKNVKPESCKGELLLHQVKFNYENKGAINIPGLSIKSGEKIAIIGSIGSGKSTLLKVLSGLYKPTEGRAFLDHVDQAHLDPDFIRDNVAYIPQNVRLFNATLRENLILGLEDDPGDDAILTAAKKCGFIETILNHPKGMGMYISEGGSGMSGGQKQLASISKLLLKDKVAVVLLDEPSSSLDNRYEGMAMNAIFSTFENATIVFATHKNNLIQYANRIIVMNNGAITMDGQRDDVLRQLSNIQSTSNTKRETKE